MTTIFSPELIRHQEQVGAARKELLRELFSNFTQLIVNTGKQAKAEALLALIANITGNELLPDQVQIFKDPNPETISIYAAEVAQAKVLSLEDSYPDKKILQPEILGAGSDVNAFTFDSNQKAQQEHKYARQHEWLNLEQFLVVRQQLLKLYCFPENGLVRVRWDMATHLVNGKEHTFNDVVEVISQPLDTELLEKYLFEAWSNGLILNSNLHFAAFEALLENDRISSIAHLPMELAEKGYQLADFVTNDVSLALCSAILQSIVANVPVHIK